MKFCIRAIAALTLMFIPAYVLTMGNQDGLNGYVSSSIDVLTGNARESLDDLSRIVRKATNQSR